MQSAERVSAAIIIVNYNSGRLVCEGLTALGEELRRLPGARTVIVDNASPDGSAREIAARIAANGWESWVELVAAPRNGGFSAGNNIAIRMLLDTASPPQYFIFLNPDTIVRPGALKTLIDFLEQNPQAGIAGSQLERPDGTVKCRSAFAFPRPLSEAGAYLRQSSPLRRRRQPLVGTESEEADWVSGAACAVRREVFERVGLLDEDYFLYFEDVDLCRRARQCGWKVWHVPVSRVVHLGGGSTGYPFQSAFRPSSWHRSRQTYFCSHFGRTGYLLANCMRSLGMLAAALRR